jgi:hypothetical protein
MLKITRQGVADKLREKAAETRAAAKPGTADNVSICR